MELISKNDEENDSSESSSELLQEENKQEITDESNINIKDLSVSEIKINQYNSENKPEKINFHNTHPPINELFLKMAPIQLFEYLFDDFVEYICKCSTNFASKRYVNRAQDTITVKVYSNQPEVTIEIGGRQLTSPVKNGSAIFNAVGLAMGENKIIATANGCSDEVIFNRQTEADEAYVYVDQHPGVNVRNWFLDEKEEAELFPEGFLSIRETINDLLASDEAMAIIDKRMPDVGNAIRDMVGTFTLDKFFHFAKPDYTEEEIKAMNEELTKISK